MKTQHELALDLANADRGGTEEDVGFWPDPWHLDDFEDLVDPRTAGLHHVEDSDGELQWLACAIRK